MRATKVPIKAELPWTEERSILVVSAELELESLHRFFEVSRDVKMAHG